LKKLAAAPAAVFYNGLPAQRRPPALRRRRLSLGLVHPPVPQRPFFHDALHQRDGPL